MSYSSRAAIPLLLAASACGPSEESPGHLTSDGGAPAVEGCDSSADFSERDTYGEWIPVELEGAVCGDGTPYKFFVRYVEGSPDVGITTEPGGACWDYDTCSGNAKGRLGVISLTGADDDHMTALPPPLGDKEGAIPWGFIFPHFGQSDASVPTKDFNQVHLPYCTGDAYSGSFETTYESTDGAESLSIHHQGRRNLELVARWLEENFAGAGRLLVLGSSAGGLGAMINYPLLRDAVDPSCSSLINDSSPLFVGDGPQKPAREAFVQRWELGELVAELEDRLGDDEGKLGADMGELSRLLSAQFPADRFVVAHFLSDLNNSQFSYVDFFEDESAEALLDRWQEDTELLVDELEGLDNWGYFIPYFRPDNCSHTLSVIPTNELENQAYLFDALAGRANGYLRTEMELESGETVDFRDVLSRVIDPSTELPAWREAPDPERGFTDAQIEACLGSE